MITSSRRCCLWLIPALVLVGLIGQSAFADTANTSLASRPVASFTAKNQTLNSMLCDLEREQGLMIGIEDWNDHPSVPYTPAQYSVILQHTTVGHVLDVLINLDGKHTWRVNGKWINIVPKSKEDDPEYWPNKRVNGKVTVSADRVVSDPEGAYAAAQSNVAIGGLTHSILTHDQAVRLKWLLEGKKGPEPEIKDVPEDKIPKLRPGSVTLDKPTVREVMNARTYFLGDHGWSIYTTPKDPAKSGTEFSASMSYSGIYTQPSP